MFRYYLAIAVQLAALVLYAWLVISWIRSGLSGAPFVPIGRNRVRPLLAMAEPGADDIVYDLGCGDARVVISAIRDFHVRRAVGIEIASLPLWLAYLRVRLAGLTGRAELRRGNMFTTDITDATVVYTYLLTGTVDRLAARIASQVRPGTRVICAAFPIDTVRHPEFRLLKEEKVGIISGYLYERTSV